MSKKKVHVKVRVMLADGVHEITATVLVYLNDLTSPDDERSRIKAAVLKKWDNKKYRDLVIVEFTHA